MSLHLQQCVPCHNDEPRLTPADIQPLMSELNDWELKTVEGVHQLHKTYGFSSYLAGLDFARVVAEMAEEVDHHPMMEIGWREVVVKWWTHNISGLHLNDFIMAARCDDTYSP